MLIHAQRAWHHVKDSLIDIIKMVLATLLIELFTMLRSLMDLIFKAVLYLSCLFYLTSSNKSLFQHVSMSAN